MDQPIAATMDEVLRLDDAGQPEAIIGSLVANAPDADSILAAIVHLMKHDRFETAGNIADRLLRIGVDHPTAHLARAFGCLFGNDARLPQGSTEALARHMDAMPLGRRVSFYQDVVTPPFLRMLTIAHDTNNVWVVMLLSEILKACEPQFREIFDWSAAPAPVQPAGKRQPSLLAYRDPPPGAPRVPRRVVVAMREHFIMPLTTTRLLDVGPRLDIAATGYGWSVELSTMRFVDAVADLTQVVAHCLRVRADVLIFDGDIIGMEGVQPLRAQMIAALRDFLPAVKIVALHLDAWQLRPDALRASALDIDAIWSCTPSMPHWADPVFSGKVLQTPIPFAGHAQAPDGLAPERISFVGGLMGYNWPRVLWRAAAMWHKLPIDWHLSFHTNDGLPALDSYADYMRRLAEGGCSLNLSMRHDLSCVITGRSFEATLMGNLLIQEAAPDLDYFFSAGKHYLPFRSFADLRGVVDFLANEPAAAQQIRRAGHDFAVGRYSDEKLIGYLDAMLFHPVADQS